MDETKSAFGKQAKIIALKLKELQKQCKDPEQRKAISVSDIVMIMQYLAEKLTEPNGDLFETGFVGHLRIIAVLANDDSIEFVDHFTEITKLICEMCVQTSLKWFFVDSLLNYWFDCIEKLSNTSKLTMFGELKSTAFVQCAQFIIDAPCISLKVQMLNILCTYLQNDPDPVSKLCSLFDGIVDQYTLNIIQSIEWKPNGLSLEDKFWILERINQMKQSIYSELVDAFEFECGGKISFEHNDGRLFFNKLTETVEFWITYKSNTVLVAISRRKMKKIQVVDSGHCFVQNLKFILNEPPRLETKNGKPIELPEFQVTTINVNFYTGIYKSRLNSMLSDMFGIVPETLVQSDENDDYDSDILEIVVLSPGSSRFSRSSRTVSQAKQSGTNSSDPKKRGAKRRVAPAQSDSMKSNITITKRTQRAAAKKAIEGISKSLNDTIDVFKDSSINRSTRSDRNQNTKNKPQSSVSGSSKLGSMKKCVAKPRKLWSQNDNHMQPNTDDESDSSPKKRRPKINIDVSLTPRSFRKSIANNPSLQMSRMMENASRINEKFKSQKNDTTQSTGQENMLDVDASCKKCSCELLETELKNINKWSRRALATINSNEYQCIKCGGTAQRTSKE